MENVNKTFRIFVSSTFSDLKEERNALQQKVFPKLRTLCMQHGFRFQAIDLRWGIRDESGQDQQTMNICLQEVARCQRPPNPNFIILLGDRYGWQPLPTEIPAIEFELIEKQVRSEKDTVLLNSWYQRDTNAVPPVYCLQPKNEQWKGEEPLLQDILRDAIINIPQNKFDEKQKIKYFTSATEQEIQAGALNVSDERDHDFAFFRELKALPELKDMNAKDYIDLIRNGAIEQHDTDAHKKLNILKDNLNKKLGTHNISTYRAEWNGNNVSTDHIPKLCDDVYNKLSKIIIKEISLIEDKPALEREIAAHKAFAKDRSKVFVGRDKMLKSIEDYIGGTDKNPLAIFGLSGTGKSALMAYSLNQTINKLHDVEVIYRFIGVTPESSNIRALLESLCTQISQIYDTVESDIPSDYKELIDEFPKRLALATGKKPLILYLDALDQLSEMDNAKNLSWLPSELPENVRLIVTTLPGESFNALQRKVPENQLLELQPMPLVEGEQLLEKWLNNAKRKLEKHQTAEILSHFNRAKNGNPLYLKLAFEESRKWKSYTKEDDTELSPDIQGVINDLFTRLSSDEIHGEMLVSRSLGYLAAAKNGLTEDELVEVLSSDLELYGKFLMEGYHIPEDVMVFLKEYIKQNDTTITGERDKDNIEINDKTATAWFNKEIKQDKDKLAAFLNSAYKESQVNKKFHFFRLPIVLWSRLYFDLEPYLTKRITDGTSLMTFYHPTTFGSAVRNRYLNKDVYVKLHRNLADYFLECMDPHYDGTFDETDLHALSELPYHLTEGERWKTLCDLLTNFSFLEQKAKKVGVQQVGIEGIKHYHGVYQIQDDYNHALSKIQKKSQIQTGATPLVVTPVDLGQGDVLVCPWCKTHHPLQNEWLGKQLNCFNDLCRGPLKVNNFVARSALNGKETE